MGLDSIKTIELIMTLKGKKTQTEVLPFLAELHANSKDEGVIKEIEALFNDIKDTRLREEIIKIIEDTGIESTKSSLIASCWQSGMNYSEYFMHFIDWSISGNYAIALECFTVIEQNIIDVPKKIKEDGLRKLNKSEANQSPDKRILINEIAKLLRQ